MDETRVWETRVVAAACRHPDGHQAIISVARAHQHKVPQHKNRELSNMTAGCQLQTDLSNPAPRRDFTAQFEKAQVLAQEMNALAWYFSTQSMCLLAHIQNDKSCQMGCMVIIPPDHGSHRELYMCTSILSRLGNQPSKMTRGE